MNTDTIQSPETLDKADSLAGYRGRFYIPQKGGKDVIYFAGNSLGLQPKTVKEHINNELEDWKALGVEGHFEARLPWKYYHEFLTSKTAKVVGANDSEVVNMNSLTVNLNLMLVSFYRPQGKRKKILIEQNTFPSDIYAVESHIKLHGNSPEDSLIKAAPAEGDTYVKTEVIEDIINKQGDEIALIMLGGVNYYTGQAFEMWKIVQLAKAKGITVGFDLAHAAGNLNLQLHKWEPDFAVWCSYKYLNAGPGAVGGCFVHEKHHSNKELNRFAGWWGHNKETRFKMPEKFDVTGTAEGWQISNPPIFQMAALNASLDIFNEAGMDTLRAKSVQLTGYLEELIRDNKNVQIITPSDKDQRGCQLSLRVGKDGKKLHQYLIDNNVICDWREPDVIRAAPVPLYNTFKDVFEFAKLLNAF